MQSPDPARPLRAVTGDSAPAPKRYRKSAEQRMAHHRQRDLVRASLLLRPDAPADERLGR